MAGMELNREDDINFAAYREGFAILTPDYMYPSAGVGQSQASGGAGGFSLVSYFGLFAKPLPICYRKVWRGDKKNSSVTE